MRQCQSTYPTHQTRRSFRSSLIRIHIRSCVVHLFISNILNSKRDGTSLKDIPRGQQDKENRNRKNCTRKMPGHLEETKTKRATFGMGCFWAGDCLFGITPGVIRTCVGYAGGVQPSPTYKNMGDHTEVIDIQYDPEIISYNQLLSLFWNNHEYGVTTKIKTQYASLILYHDEDQRIIAEKSREHEQSERGEILTTEIRQFEKFYPAEDYHQKYRLQSHGYLLESFGLTTPELIRTSPIAAKLNGYVSGATKLELFTRDTFSKNLNDKQYQYLKQCIIEMEGTGLYC